MTALYTFSASPAGGVKGTLPPAGSAAAIAASKAARSGARPDLLLQARARVKDKTAVAVCRAGSETFAYASHCIM